MRISSVGDYKMANGQKAVVLEIFEGMAYGRGFNKLNKWWAPCRWSLETGQALISNEMSVVGPWEEPEELVPHWPAILRYKDGSGYYLSSDLYTEDDMGDLIGFVSLAKWYAPIMLPRVKK